MSSFNGFGLFDPDGQDDDSDSELLLSASELLEKRSRKPPKRSHTDLDLKPCSSSVPRSNTSLDLKSTLKEGKACKVWVDQELSLHQWTMITPTSLPSLRWATLSTS